MNKDEFKTTTPDGTQVIVVPIKSALLGFISRSILVLVIYAVVATGEMALHWYAGTQQSATALSLRTWYLERDLDNGKEIHRGYADWEWPATLLGVAAGIVLARSWMWAAELVIWALFLSGGILALFPFYKGFFPELTGGPAATGFVFGALMCGFFVGVGRVLTAHLLKRKSQKNAESHDPSA